MPSCLRFPLATAASLLLLAPAAALAQGGPDAGGHIWNSTTYDFVVLDPGNGGAGAALPMSTSDQEFDVTLPWAFPYYGNTYSTVTVAENGGIMMGGGANLYGGNGSLPDTSSNSADIAVFWDSIEAWDSGPVGAIFVYDDTANSRFIVSWEAVGAAGDPGTGSFQAHLMADGTMSFHYADTDFGDSDRDFGASATVGIQDFTNGTAGSGNALEVLYNTAGITDGVTAYAVTFCADGDVDGYYDVACGGDDCDDAAASVNPGGTEVCNDTIDQDCSGADSIDDFDADTYINADCGGDDCDDLDAAINVAATELCDDSIDNDCDAATPDIFDGDADTYDCTVDCDDTDAAANPGATEICADGIDNDCDGIPLQSDNDFDGELSIACGGTDCNDFDASLNNTTDADADGSVSCDDCDDNDATAVPGGTEICDGVDNDCDGAFDSAVSSTVGDPATDILSGTNRGRGGKFTMDANATLNSLGAHLDVDAGRVITFAIYERAGTATDFTKMWTGLHTSPAGGAMNHIVPVSFPLVAGNDYVFAYFWGASILYFETDPSQLPISSPYATYTDGVWINGAVPPVTVDPGLNTNQYSLIVTMGDELGDFDADGVTFCAGDCDDNDALNVPGGVEVCDGQDNNCDTIADDVDLDADTEIDEACGGTDCNDADASVGMNATELCDTVDSDCDGLSDEFDSDIGTVLDTPTSLTSAPGVFFDETADVTDTITVSGTANPVLDINVTVNVTHTWTSDVTMSLTSPTGTTVVLTARNGDSSDNFTGTVFDDAASTPMSSGSPPFAGSFQPDQPLAGFNGEAADGAWVITMSDALLGDDGTLVDWTLDIISGISSDVDGDGVVSNTFLCTGVEGDCNDADASIYLGAPEICGDTIDQDCDGLDTTGDVDTDTFDSVECGGTDCDDTNILVFDGSDNDADQALGCQDDCDDTNDAVNPAATEVCSDGLDNDCDGVAFEGADVDADGETDCTDCDDEDATVNSAATEVCADGIDNDCSGAADDLDADSDGGIALECGGNDCDDADATSYVNAPELCDALGVDNDCDGLGDDQDLDLGGVPVESWTSAPGSAITSDNPITTDTATLVSTAAVTDVNLTLNITHTWTADLDIYLVSPTGTRVEITTDNGSSGDNFTDTVFDDDATTGIDTVGSSDAPFTGSWQPEGSLADFNGEVPTGDWTLEITDDQGGDIGTLDSWTLEVWTGTLPTGIDDDSDGYINATLCANTQGDCNDADAGINPAIFDICGDTIDQDCSGADEPGDFDADTYIGEDCGGDDCDDTNAAVNPGAAEVCADTIDNDCDGGTYDLFDDDGDSVPCDMDCDDTNALAYPGFGFDICGDGVDNDCDATTLDTGDLDADGVPCETDCDDTNPIISPLLPELLCTGLDEDCDQGVLTPDVDDGDGDGFNCDVDCTDTDAAVNPAAVEVACDAIDNDCDVTTDGEVDVDLDGVTCGLDCDDNDATAFPGNTEVCNDAVDNDCDAVTIDNFDNDGDGVDCVTDCDDADPLANPLAPEICGDGIDQDCDTMVDEPVDDAYGLSDDDSVLIGLCNFDFPFCGTDWDEIYVQSNGRLTFGFDATGHTESAAQFLAEAPEIAAMWNDLDPAAGGTVSIEEVADTGSGASLIVRWTDVPDLGVAGSANTAVLTLWDDGTANLNLGDLSMTDGLVGYSCDGTGTVVETDISEYELLPNAWALGTGTETAFYELFDDQLSNNDLDNTIMDLCLTGGADTDGDGWTDVCGDCDDTSASAFPGATEVCGDSLDNDCNGVADDADLDLDGEIDEACGGDDCNDADDTINTDATEACNGIDDDCDGSPEDGGEDADADGFLICDGDCDDGDATINPDGIEVCDQVDNDCDGVDDNGFTPDADDDGVISDDCAGDDCDDTNAAVYPGADEICDLADNDCNGEVDEIDFDEDTFLDAACGGDDCDDANPDVNPAAEEVPYDGLDNDCLDGDVVDADGDGYFGGDDGTDCNDADAAINPGAEEICDDEIDNNCDLGIDLGDRGNDIPADVTCRTGCQCESSVADADGAPGALMLLLGLAGLMGVRRRRVV